MPHIHPLGYRIVIAPADRFSARNPAFSNRAYDEPAVAYSSASGNRYFGWADAGSDDARKLADKFVARFPALVQECAGSDWCYAGWLSDLLAALERQPDALPFVMEEYMETPPEELRSIPMKSTLNASLSGDFPLPPEYAGEVP